MVQGGSDVNTGASRATLVSVQPLRDMPDSTEGTCANMRTAEPLLVMHVIYRLQPGGMEYGVLKIVNGLDRRLVRSSVCSTTPATDMRRSLRPDVPLFEFHRRAGNDVRLVVDLTRLFRRERPTIVHTHSWGTLCEGLLAARIARVPRVVHGEHGTLQIAPHQLWMQRFAWSRVDQVLSVSSRLAERMARATGFPLARIRTIRNGVDLARFGATRRAHARSTLELAENELVIGTVGRLVPVKDHSNLLDALARLHARGIAATLVIAGDGPLRGTLESQVVALGLDGRVRFLGYRPDVETVLAALDIFVLSSESEGLSNTILEAMAAGVPPVATAVGGSDELVERGVSGLLVPPKDAEALTCALAELCVSVDRRLAMGQAARERAATQFSLSAMVRDYEQLYLDLAGRRG